MSDKIVLEFTKKQFRTLLDVIYAGNMMISGIVDNDEEKYNEIESLVFSKAKEIGKAEFAEYDKEYGGFLPTDKFSNDGVNERMQAYDEYTFWSELYHRLALRDVAEKMTDATDPDMLFEAIVDRTDEYEEFFDKNGLNKLVVKGMKDFTQTAKTFRSMNVGKLETSDDIDECSEEECHCHDDKCHCHDDKCHCHDDQCHCHDDECDCEECHCHDGECNCGDGKCNCENCNCGDGKCNCEGCNCGDGKCNCEGCNCGDGKCNCEGCNCGDGKCNCGNCKCKDGKCDCENCRCRIDGCQCRKK